MRAFPALRWIAAADLALFVLAAAELLAGVMGPASLLAAASGSAPATVVWTNAIVLVAATPVAIWSAFAERDWRRARCGRSPDHEARSSLPHGNTRASP